MSSRASRCCDSRMDCGILAVALSNAAAPPYSALPIIPLAMLRSLHLLLHDSGLRCGGRLLFGGLLRRKTFLHPLRYRRLALLYLFRSQLHSGRFRHFSQSLDDLRYRTHQNLRRNTRTTSFQRFVVEYFQNEQYCLSKGGHWVFAAQHLGNLTTSRLVVDDCRGCLQNARLRVTACLWDRRFRFVHWLHGAPDQSRRLSVVCLHSVSYLGRVLLM